MQVEVGCGHGTFSCIPPHEKILGTCVFSTSVLSSWPNVYFSFIKTHVFWYKMSKSIFESIFDKLFLLKHFAFQTQMFQNLFKSLKKSSICRVDSSLYKCLVFLYKNTRILIQDSKVFIWDYFYQTPLFETLCFSCTNASKPTQIANEINVKNKNMLHQNTLFENTSRRGPSFSQKYQPCPFWIKMYENQCKNFTWFQIHVKMDPFASSKSPCQNHHFSFKNHHLLYQNTQCFTNFTF